VGISAAAGLVATSRAAVIAVGMLAFLLTSRQVMRFGLRPLSSKSASGTDT